MSVFRKYRNKRSTLLARLMKYKKKDHCGLKYKKKRFQIDPFIESADEGDAWAEIERNMIEKEAISEEHTSVSDTEGTNTHLVSDEENINHEMPIDGMEVEYVSILEISLLFHSLLILCIVCHFI